MFLVHHTSDGHCTRGSLLVLMYYRTLPSNTPTLSEFFWSQIE